jgi:hypothetical protein
LALLERPAREPEVNTHASREYDLWVWMPQLSVVTLVDQ